MYFDNSSASHLEGEQDIDITETNADLYTPNLTETQNTLVENKTKTEEIEERGKHVKKPSQHIVDLLEGCGVWTNKPSDSLVSPGVQLMAEGGANDDLEELALCCI